MIILFHSSKTMRANIGDAISYQQPLLFDRAQHINAYLNTLGVAQLQGAMKVSPPVAAKAKQQIMEWDISAEASLPAIDAFLGDMYSGLQVRTFDQSDRDYANEHLYILSGLYGVLRALDSVQPYRLEMAYKFSDEPFTNLYKYWGDVIARCLSKNAPIVNVSSVEYTKAVFPYLRDVQIVTPKFLTRDSKTGEPKFVTIHAKVARGAFAHWMIKNRIETLADLPNFDELNYAYDESLSTTNEPVFVCDTFGGLGLSVRLTGSLRSK